MKVIRDNLHGDIEFYPEEMRLLHTAGFERLHGCRQLGLSHLIYPCAKHSRFEHVLGVMHVADQIAGRMKEQGSFFEGDSGEELRRILRFAALLHDMGHVPFGHTLEDEMPVISKHDDPSPDGEQKPSRMDSAVTEVLKESGNAKFIKPVLQVLRAIAESKHDDVVYESVQRGELQPEYLVLADIVGNTICADLLDYIKRDHSMTGIRATYDSRIFRYFGVDKHNGFKRVVIQLVKNGRVRNDALADLLDILKLRYNLSDKVLFHPKKCAADAMLIRAISEAGMKEEDLMQLTDDGLLDQLRDEPLIKLIRQWKLYKPVFVCGKTQITSYNDQFQKNDLIKRLHRDETLRRKIEGAIEREIGLSGTGNQILVFCPSPNMTLKSVRALVKWKDGTVRRLNEIQEEDDALIRDQVTMLQEIYPQLWKLYLFCQPKLRSWGDTVQQKFCEVLEAETGLTATCDPAFRHYLRGTSEFQLGKLLDQELSAHPEVNSISQADRLDVGRRCHERIPSDPLSDDEFSDQESQVLASRRDETAVRRRLTGIIDDVLKERKLTSKKQGQLELASEAEN